MGTVVAIEGRPGPEWVEALRRCWDGGDAVLPVDHRLPPPAVAALYRSVRPAVVRSLETGEDRALPDGRVTGGDDALVVATSGTTGAPRAIVLTHAAVNASAEATARRLDVDPERDAWIGCLPVAHVGGLGVVCRALVTGTPLTMLEGFDAARVTAAARDLAAAGRRPLVSLVATALRRLDPSSFRIVLLGGDAPPAWGPPDWPEGRPAPVVVTYGMTETGGGCVYDGVALGGVEVEVSGEGEVLVRGPVLGRCAIDGAGEVPLTDPDGWLVTGDGGHIGPDGALVVDGRIGDVIVTGGEKVWPAPVEAVLRRCPGVAAVAVIGRPDPAWGSRVVAVVVPEDRRDPPALETLRATVRLELAPWAAPRELELVDALPVTALGKVRRGALRSG